MSYILDALKKSESERGHGAIPGVQTVHSSSINYHQQKKAIWPYFLIAAVFLNIVVIAYFIYTQNTPAQSVSIVPVVQNNSMLTSPAQVISSLSPSTQSISTPMPSAIEKAPVRITPVTTTSVESEPIYPASQIAEITPTSPVADKQPLKDDRLNDSALTRDEVDSKVIEEPAVSPQFIAEAHELANEQILEQHELPEDIQRQLPALIISAHVYSSNPSQRSLIVNNVFLEEKDYIMDDIILYEITRDGAIFSYNGLLFHNRSVSGWQ